MNGDWVRLTNGQELRFVTGANWGKHHISGRAEFIQRADPVVEPEVDFDRVVEVVIPFDAIVYYIDRRADRG